jgi:RNA recognition motif-containing protein
MSDADRTPRIPSGQFYSGEVFLVFNIYVGNMSFDTTESEIRELFSAHGEVERVNIITDRDTGRPRGFCFVEMAEEEAGRAAIDALNNSEFGGRTLTVNEARPRAPRGGGGNRGGGGGRRDLW